MTMPSDAPLRARPLGRRSFAECVCAYHHRPLADFPRVAWLIGAAWPVRLLRPVILFFAPRYFEAEDVHLERVAGCRRRCELVEEMALLRASFLRRGIWRYLGCGINGDRILRFYDQLVAADRAAAAARGEAAVSPVQRAAG